MILELHVQPGARASGFAGRDVRIVAGFKSRQKRVEISGLP